MKKILFFFTLLLSWVTLFAQRDTNKLELPYIRSDRLPQQIRLLNRPGSFTFEGYRLVPQKPDPECNCPRPPAKRSVFSFKEDSLVTEFKDSLADILDSLLIETVMSLPNRSAIYLGLSSRRTDLLVIVPYVQPKQPRSFWLNIHPFVATSIGFGLKGGPFTKATLITAGFGVLWRSPKSPWEFRLGGQYWGRSNFDFPFVLPPTDGPEGFQCPCEIDVKQALVSVRAEVNYRKPLRKWTGGEAGLLGSVAWESALSHAPVPEGTQSVIPQTLVGLFAYWQPDLSWLWKSASAQIFIGPRLRLFPKDVQTMEPVHVGALFNF